MTVEDNSVYACRGVKMMVDTQPFSDTLVVALGYKIGHEFYCAKPVEFDKFAEGHGAKPSFLLHPQEAQELFNHLWTMGYRPRDGTGNEGHIAALKYHLEDLRKLVFKEKK